MPHARRSRQRGLSLIESVVSLGVLLGALQVAVPLIGDMVEAAALRTAAEDLLLDLHLARMEALKRNRRVALCKSADGLQCTRSGGWEQGWIVFHDENNDGTLGDGEDRIAHHEALKPWLRLRGNTPVANYVSYTPLGSTRFVGGGFQAGTLTLCRRSIAATESREVILNAVGRPRVQKGTVADCDP